MQSAHRKLATLASPQVLQQQVSTAKLTNLHSKPTVCTHVAAPERGSSSLGQAERTRTHRKYQGPVIRSPPPPPNDVKHMQHDPHSFEHCQDQTLLQTLTEKLEIQDSIAQLLLHRQPDLASDWQPDVLASRIQGLGQTLGLVNKEVVVMVSRQPAMLTCTPRMLAEQLAHISDMLEIPAHQIAPILAKQPEMLEVPPARLGTRACQLAMLLNLNDITAQSQVSSGTTQRQHQDDQTQAPDKSLTYGLGLVDDMQGASEQRLQQEMDLALDLDAWAMPDEMLLPPGAMGPSHNATRRQMSVDPNYEETPVPNVRQQASNTQGTGHQERLSKRAKLCLAGLQVLTRLPSQQFFTMVSVPASMLQRRMLVLEELLQLGNPGVTCQVVAASPQLLTQPLQATMDAWQALCQGPLSSTTAGAARKWLCRCASLLTLPANNIKDTYNTICHELGFNTPPLRARVLQQPGLLKMSSEDFRQHLSEMAAVLGVDDRAVRRMVRGSPGVARYSCSVIQSKMQELEHLLRCTRAQVTEILLQQPALLTNSIASLSKKISHISRTLAWSQDEVLSIMTVCPTLLTCKSATIVATAQQLQQLLNWDESELRTAVLMYPQLLSMSGLAVKQRINELAAALDFNIMNKHVRQLVAACPMCLLNHVNPNMVSAAVRLIADKLQHARNRQQSAVQADGAAAGQDAADQCSGDDSNACTEVARNQHASLILAVSAICKQPALLDAAYRKVMSAC